MFPQTLQTIRTALQHVISHPASPPFPSDENSIAAAHMWGATSELSDSFSGFPYGIYTIPEISMVGYTEAQLTQEKVPYELGIARYVGLFHKNRVNESRRKGCEMRNAGQPSGCRLLAT